MALLAHQAGTARIVGIEGRIDVPAPFHHPTRLVHTVAD